MSLHSRNLAKGLLIALMLQGVSVLRADAQTASPRPFRGLFRNRLGASELGHKLDLQWSLLGSYDGTADPVGAGGDGASQVGGGFYRPVFDLTYGYRARRASFSLVGRGGGRYYQRASSLNGLDGSVTATINAQLRPGTQLEARQRFVTAPYFQLDALAGGVPVEWSDAAAPDVPLLARRSNDKSGEVSLRQRVGRRTRLMGEVAYQNTGYETSDAQNRYNATARWLLDLTRYANLRVGYGIGRFSSEFSGERTDIDLENIDAGVDYNRPLSFSRKTTIGVSTGIASAAQRGDRDYQFVADGRLRRELQRNWNVSLLYRRGFQFSTAVAEPVLANSGQVQLSGLLGRRVELNGIGAYISGRTTVSSLNADYSSWLGGSGMRFAFSRLFSLEASYAYAWYRFGRSARLPEGVLSGLNRHSVRVGITGWLPLVH
jgi:opacity protein-like surface antigen